MGFRRIMKIAVSVLYSWSCDFSAVLVSALQLVSLAVLLVSYFFRVFIARVFVRFLISCPCRWLHFFLGGDTRV